MPVLRTNYKAWSAKRDINTNRIYLGPVNFSINAYTNASAVGVVSAQTVMSIFKGNVEAGCKLVPFVIEPISFSTYSYSGPAGSYLMYVSSMWASGSLALFNTSLSTVAGPSNSAPVICRMTALVCSGP